MCNFTHVKARDFVCSSDYKVNAGLTRARKAFRHLCAVSPMPHLSHPHSTEQRATIFCIIQVDAGLNSAGP